ncbi:MAG: WG repeat-containing protein [Clostridia bacterium]|nr:WG repeat-containing protein [Clostridia bacterium]
MWGERLDSLVQKFIPIGAVIIKPQNPYGVKGIQVIDLDGDGRQEIVTCYKWGGEIGVLVLKSNGGSWYRIADIKGWGYGFSYVGCSDITGNGRNDLVIGWQTGARDAELNVFSWESGGIKRIVGSLLYSMLEVEDMPAKYGIDKKAELALWSLVTGDIYSVEVLRWDSSRLITAQDVYPYYFKRVVKYYEQKVREMPEEASYREYLAEAQIKAGIPDESTELVEAGAGSSQDCVLQNEFKGVKDKAESEVENRIQDLHPAAEKVIGGVKWGYINNKGEFTIKPIYDWAEDFQDNGLAVVGVGGLSGVIDKTGKYVVEPKYDSINQFSEGLATAYSNQKFSVINTQGKVIFESEGYIDHFHDGRAAFVNGTPGEKWLYGYIDKQGKIVIKPRYKSAGNFKNGKAVVELDEGGYAIIDPNSQILKKFNYAFVGDISDGLLPFKEKADGKFGFIDEKGNVVIAPKFSGVEGFVNGRAVVNVSEDYTNYQYGLIDKKGKFIIDPKYNDVRILGEGMAAAGTAIDKENMFKGAKYAIADINGKFLTDYIYYGVSQYENGYASVYDNTSTFFIDKTGKKAANLPSVNGIGTLSFEGDLIKANVDNRIWYIDKSGRTIWKPNSQVRLNNRYIVKEVKYRPNRNYLVYYPEISGMDSPKSQEELNKKLKDIAITQKVGSSQELDFSYDGDYEVDFYQKNLLGIEFTGYEYPFGAAHGMPRKEYAHVDLKSGSFYELKDLFKKDSNYVKVLSDIIRKQIEAQGEDSPVWMESYKGIKADQPFYITKDALNIYFYPYEIASFAAGFPTFRIPFNDIMSIINTEGSFWRSFK